MLFNILHFYTPGSKMSTTNQQLFYNIGNGCPSKHQQWLLGSQCILSQLFLSYLKKITINCADIINSHIQQRSGSFTTSAHWQSSMRCSWSRWTCLKGVWNGHRSATAAATCRPPSPTGRVSRNARRRKNRSACTVLTAHNCMNWQQARHGFHG